MSKPPDIDTLARRYLDLWQDQLSALAADQNVAEVTAKTIELMNSGLTAMASVAETATRSSGPGGAEPSPQQPSKDHDNTIDSPGTTTVAATSGRSDHDLAEFSRRLGALEQRVAQLETGTGTSGKGSRTRPKRRRS
ncbi:MAG: hypothetical protein QGI13_00480 [Rhodospirillales bacterium]|jgi:hypothetical protein|nr:hypothetical protein [Rhodospirillales bacterium]